MKILIFSGYNPRAVISFCRLASEYNLDFDIIAAGYDDNILETEYKSNVKIIRESKNIDIDFIYNLIKSYNGQPLFILPSTEYLNRILLSNKKVLNENNVQFGLVDLETYELISDKVKFNDLCKLYGIEVPVQFESIPEKIPFVAKPKTYFGTNNNIETPYIILNKDDLDTFVSKTKIEDFYFQEYLIGDSIYFLFYFTKEKKYSVFSQQNYIQQEKGGSILFAKSSTHHTDLVINKFVKMFTDINFYGLVMVEVRKINNRWIMIEANPRLWGPSQLILDSGMDLFDLFLSDNLLISNPKIRNFTPNVQYLWSADINSTSYLHTNSDKQTYDIKYDIYNRPDTIKLFNNERN